MEQTGIVQRGRSPEKKCGKQLPITTSLKTSQRPKHLQTSVKEADDILSMTWALWLWQVNNAAWHLPLGAELLSERHTNIARHGR